jgi:hypothetical protein
VTPHISEFGQESRFRQQLVEATIFTGWIYDRLLPHAEKVKVAHPWCCVPLPQPGERTTALMLQRAAKAKCSLSFDQATISSIRYCRYPRGAF